MKLREEAAKGDMNASIDAAWTFNFRVNIGLQPCAGLRVAIKACVDSIELDPVALIIYIRSLAASSPFGPR